MHVRAADADGMQFDAQIARAKMLFGSVDFWKIAQAEVVFLL